MKCIVFGHSYVIRKGVGDYAEREFMVCTECGASEMLDWNRSPALVKHDEGNKRPGE